ncbi:hypothetical protein [Marinactinospora rubrisoli]|uniref:Type I restriction enzyme R protein N-terminal domain-containing protein n=1 Tax=Marinactinospora rubrisoli TaxID=2715399 RepID=A0ABW2KGZ9_9ACTN
MDVDATQVLTRTGEFPVSGDLPQQWEAEARNRVAQAVERFSGPLKDLLDRDANEGDTRMLVTDFLSEGLDYQKYDHLTTEYRTQGESADYGIRIDDRLFALTEVKRCGQDLDARNLRQVRTVAAGEDVEWLVLTNGRVWQVYHLTDGSVVERVLEVDLLDEENRTATIDALFHLSRSAVQHERLAKLREWRVALERAPLAEALQAPAVIDAIRREVRQRTGHTGHVGDTEDVLQAVRDVIPSGLLED